MHENTLENNAAGFFIARRKKIKKGEKPFPGLLSLANWKHHFEAMSALWRAFNSLTNLRSDIALRFSNRRPGTGRSSWNTTGVARALFLVFQFDGQERKTNNTKRSNSIGFVVILMKTMLKLDIIINSSTEYQLQMHTIYFVIDISCPTFEDYKIS